MWVILVLTMMGRLRIAVLADLSYYNCVCGLETAVNRNRYISKHQTISRRIGHSVGFFLKSLALSCPTVEILKNLNLSSCRERATLEYLFLSHFFSITYL